MKNCKDKLGFRDIKNEIKEGEKEVQVSLTGAKVEEFEPDLCYPEVVWKGRIKRGGLCSNSHYSNNSEFSQNSTQTQVKTDLKNGDIEQALKDIQDYINRANKTFYQFKNTENGKIFICPKTTRFSKQYIYKIRQKLNKLKGIQNISITHFTLTIPYSDNSDYIKAYNKLKKDVGAFIKHLSYRTKRDLLYLYTFESTENNGLYHLHIHLLVFGLGFLPKKVFFALRHYWFKIANSKYFYVKYIPKERNYNPLSYVLKYITKETGQANLTTAILFSVKGKAFTMSLKLSKLCENKEVKVKGVKYVYVGVLYEPCQVFRDFLPSDYDTANLTWFYSLLSPGEAENLKKQAIQLEQYQLEQEKQKQQEKEARDRFLKSITIKI